MFMRLRASPLFEILCMRTSNLHICLISHHPLLDLNLRLLFNGAAPCFIVISTSHLGVILIWLDDLSHF